MCEKPFHRHNSGHLSASCPSSQGEEQSYSPPQEASALLVFAIFSDCSGEFMTSFCHWTLWFQVWPKQCLRSNKTSQQSWERTPTWAVDTWAVMKSRAPCGNASITLDIKHDWWGIILAIYCATTVFQSQSLPPTSQLRWMCPVWTMRESTNVRLEQLVEIILSMYSSLY